MSPQELLHAEQARQSENDQSLTLLINAMRDAQAGSPGEAHLLAVSAYLAVFGQLGLSSLSNALRSS